MSVPHTVNVVGGNPEILRTGPAALRCSTLTCNYHNFMAEQYKTVVNICAHDLLRIPRCDTLRQLCKS